MDSDQDKMTAFFREVVLVLGGVFAVQGVDDETVQRAADGLERAWRRARGKTRQGADGHTVPNPALSALLRLIAEEKEEDENPICDDDYVRLPGLYMRWEWDRVIEPGTYFYVDEAGEYSDGTQLFVVYRKEPKRKDSALKPTGRRGNPSPPGGCAPPIPGVEAPLVQPGRTA